MLTFIGAEIRNEVPERHNDKDCNIQRWFMKLQTTKQRNIYNVNFPPVRLSLAVEARLCCLVVSATERVVSRGGNPLSLCSDALSSQTQGRIRFVIPGFYFN